MAELAIRRPKLETIQTRWIAVNFAGNTWESYRFQRVNGEQRRKLHTMSAECSSLFDHLVSITGNGESWWICGWEIYEALCKFGMWESIRAGKLRLTKNQERTVGNGAKYSRSRLHGSLICENPPTIIDCQLENGARVKFIDPRNWGVEKSMIVDEGEQCTVMDTVQAIEDYICLVETLKMGQLKHTAASQGYYCYRLHHMKQDIIADNEPAARVLERESYYAGRCEAFRIGDLHTGIIHVDVTSMYSSFGFDKTFPTRLIAIHSRPTHKTLGQFNHDHHYIGRCTISTKSPAFPVRIDKRVIYPTGEYITTLPWPELQLAISMGAVVKIHSLAEYECAPIFESYSHWYRESLADLHALGLSHLRNALKFAVNASYGKFAARAREWMDRPNDVACYEWDQWWQRHPKTSNVVQWRSIEGHVQFLDAGTDPDAAMPAISATMSSYGRVYLWELMRCAGQYSVFYVDTDGLMVDDDGYERLRDAGHIQPGVFGKLRIREVSTNVHIIGIKHYKFGERYVCAGVPLKNMVVHDKHTEYDRHVPFEYTMWHDRPFDHRYDRLTRPHVQKYKHGYVYDNGNIAPFAVGKVENEHVDAAGNATKTNNYAILGSSPYYAW